MATPGALLHVDDNEILDRIRAGEHASSVAAHLGVHKSALSHRYKARKEYLEARETGTEVRLNDLEAEITALSKPLPQPTLVDAATEQQITRYKVELKAWQMSHAEREFNLACARERYRAVSWRAEREFPERWGAKGLNININNSQVVITDHLAGAAGDLLSRLTAQPLDVVSEPEMGVISGDPDTKDGQ